MPAPKEGERKQERGGGEGKKKRENMKEMEEEWCQWAGAGVGSKKRRESIKWKSPMGIIIPDTLLLNQP